MKLLNFSPKNMDTPKLGVVWSNSRILDVKEAYRNLREAEPPSWFSNVDKTVSGGEDALELLKKFISSLNENKVEEFLYDSNSIIYYPPILKPSKVLNMSVNYITHGKEAQLKELPKEPFLFIKLPTCLIGHKQSIIIPKSSKEVDYEGELAVIIGKRCKNVTKSEAYRYVIGYTIFNDVSYRDRRLHQMMKEFGINWLHGKSLDNGSPIGPWLVTKDEIEDPHSLHLVTIVNDEIKQNDNTRNMIFKIPEIIEYASNDITLYPGDIISTGTPSGVGLGTGKYLKTGDIVTVRLEKIGELQNDVVS
ncbi:Fumarylacetoacetate hydrolase family protein [Saccharolobus shibatae B12]|uniref:Fumarylacetoacetate hydrolase family protein n=1 Tax=Saccharolobus shibatae (strain ATCC 51178 / DSM 5389 / JCM 8931 / NBRC 15437 / B12) TaxID=523848 RepID=A0A8F5GTH6_SACSH|nr:fumarylacetoacetate hydrolase family protein [Saccharolobus shibatae]QXJ28905.1 Fumarylacetoacetate hydrolase family protein [Saccharolobus shibatae B12]